MLKISHPLRFNRRYVLVNASEKAIKESLLDYTGLLGWAKAAPVFIEHARGTVVAVNREELVHVRAAFALSAHDIEVIAVSGTLEGIERHLKKRKNNS